MAQGYEAGCEGQLAVSPATAQNEIPCQDNDEPRVFQHKSTHECIRNQPEAQPEVRVAPVCGSGRAKQLRRWMYTAGKLLFCSILLFSAAATPGTAATLAACGRTLFCVVLWCVGNKFCRRSHTSEMAKQVLPAVAYVRNGLISEPIRVEIVFSQLAFARNNHRATGDAAGRFRYSSAQGHCIPFHSMRKQLPLDSKCAVNKGYSTVTRFAYPDMPMFCRFHW